MEQVRDDLWEDEDTTDEIQTLLLETAWESNLDKLQPALEQLRALALE